MKTLCTLLMLLLISSQLTPQEKPTIETFRTLWINYDNHVYEQWGYISAENCTVPLGKNNYAIPSCNGNNIPPQIFKKGKCMNAWNRVVKNGETSLWLVQTTN